MLRLCRPGARATTSALVPLASLKPFEVSPCRMSSIFTWFRDFWRALNPGPTDPILWHCKPLLICDADDRPVFKAAVIDVEFTPDAVTPQSGIARIVNWQGPLPVPELTVRRLVIRGLQRRDGHGREGAILRGRYRGKAFSWYTDGRADDVARKMSGIALRAARPAPARRARRARAEPFPEDDSDT